jgi:formylglycine-generating enzyme required for sulfatase activity
MAYRAVQKGDRVSEYVLAEKLGQGGFGEVWKAEHSQIAGKFVAIKIPTTPESMDCLKQEAVFQHELDHPNIVRTIGLNTQNDPPYFIMEYVEGKNLRQMMLDDGILPPPYAIDIAVQACEALSFAHGKGIVHKDVKPENILVEKKKIDVSNKGKALLHYVKLTDLGLGIFPGQRQSEIVISENARTSGVRILSGTLFYMAPEQMFPGRQVDCRADVYSLGVVLYEMLTGELPLGMDLPSELNPVVTPELDQVCKKALSIDRDTRYQSMREMAADLQRAKEALLLKLVSSGAPALEVTPQGEIRRLTPREVPLPQPAVVRTRRRRWKPALEWGFLAFVVALLAGSGWAFYRLNRTPRRAKEAPAGLRPEPVRLGGPLIIDTRPQEAEVWLDDRRVGVAPVQLEQVSFERHTVRLVKEFFVTRELVLDPRIVEGRRRFSVIDRAGQREIALRDCQSGLSLEGLELLPQKGKVLITTPQVDRAEVTIDGEPYGPTRLEREINAGPHRFTVSKDGYKEFSFVETVYGGGTLEKPVALLPLGSSEPAVRSATIRVHLTSSPSGAEVVLNDEEKGQTPCTVELPAGDYSLRLLKKYYEPYSGTLAVNGPVTRDYPLARVKARVSYDSEPQGATVYVDGAEIGTTPVASDQVEAGKHKATFVLSGHHDQSFEFEIVSRDPSDRPVKATLQRIPPGKLAVDAEIRGAEVFLNGRSIGPAPTVARAMDAGKHRLRVLGAERTVTIEAGVEQKATFTLKDLQMVRIPEGDFRFGSEAPSPSELSGRTERTAAFHIDLYEVTNAQYALFHEWISQTNDHSRCHPGEGKRDHRPAFWGDEKYARFNLPAHPVVGVSWYDACAYAAWAGKRLPTEQEWEKASRGMDGRIYPWGNDWDGKRCNSSSKLDDGFEDTAPVGLFPSGRSPYGCFDMVGNAREWCASDYMGRGPNRQEKPLGKVVRGGSYLGRDYNSTTMREYESAHHTSSTLGFRCVADEKR